MQAVIIKELLKVILAVASEAVVKAIAQAVIQAVRGLVIESENKIDDMIVLPLLDKLEESFDLDDDE